jgi:hypothetical protein
MTFSPSKKAEAGELVLLSQDEARFSMIQTLRTPEVSPSLCSPRLFQAAYR